MIKIFDNQIYLNKGILWREGTHDMESWELIVQFLMQHGHDLILFISCRKVVVLCGKYKDYDSRSYIHRFIPCKIYLKNLKIL